MFIRYICLYVYNVYTMLIYLIAYIATFYIFVCIRSRAGTQLTRQKGKARSQDKRNKNNLKHKKDIVCCFDCCWTWAGLECDTMSCNSERLCYRIWFHNIVRYIVTWIAIFHVVLYMTYCVITCVSSRTWLEYIEYDICIYRVWYEYDSKTTRCHIIIYVV